MISNWTQLAACLAHAQRPSLTTNAALTANIASWSMARSKWTCRPLQRKKQFIKIEVYISALVHKFIHALVP